MERRTCKGTLSACPPRVRSWCLSPSRTWCLNSAPCSDGSKEKHLTIFTVNRSIFYVRTLSNPASDSLRFHCVGRSWDRTQDFGIGKLEVLITRLDLIHTRLSTHLSIFYSPFRIFNLWTKILFFQKKNHPHTFAIQHGEEKSSENETKITMIWFFCLYQLIKARGRGILGRVYLCMGESD